MTTRVRSRRKAKAGPVACAYNSRLQKGGALLEDMRFLVRNWQDGGINGQRDSVIAENLLGKHTRARAADILRRSFLPRFVHGQPLQAWKMLRTLEAHNLPIEIIRPVYYWITARNELLLYDFVCAELFHYYKTGQSITTDEVYSWIVSQLATCGKHWSPTVTTKVARGVLATLRDFGVLAGIGKKRMAPAYLPIESVAYIAFALSQEGVSGLQLVSHNDWALFLFSPPIVEQMFLEADRHGLLRFQAAGNIVRIDFPSSSFEEMADVIATRAS